MRISHFLNLFVWLCLLFFLSIPTLAETVDPSVWQNSSKGLLTTSNNLKKTAGLGLHIDLSNQSDWPQVYSLGGATDGDGTLIFYNEHGDPYGIQLGQIKIPNTAPASYSQNSDWSRNTINVNSGLLEVMVSRMTLATLVSTTSNSVQLFAGNVTGAATNGTNVTNKAPSPSSPKYIAYHTASGYRVAALQTGNLPLSDMDQNWVLVWYGTNSHFLDTRVPDLFSTKNGINYGGETAYLVHKQAYQSDIPMLLTFQKIPLSINQLSDGGIQLDFSGGMGDMTIMPLFGRDHPEASITENWGVSKNLPESGRYNVISKLEFWVPRSCNFPTSVVETYSYSESTDTTTIRDDIVFKQICPSNVTFAPIPPTLAMAKDALGITFSGSVVDSYTHTNFGPLLGIENVNSYSWHLSGLKKYTNINRKLTDTGTAPNELVQKLREQIDNITNAGHLAPWVFNDKMPVNFMLGEIYWMNLADTLYQLSEVVEILPEPQKTNLIHYLRSERENANYNPETVYNLKHTEGAFRPDFALTDPRYLNEWGSNNPHGRADAFLDHVPLYSFFGLARYYKVTGDDLNSTVLDNAKKSLNSDLSDMDWATFSPFQKPRVPHSAGWPGFAERRYREAVIEQNRLFAGLIGFVQIAEQANDQESEYLGRALLARSAVTRLSMLKYPRYLYSFGFVKLPDNPKWQIIQTETKSGGANIPNYNWSDPNGFDDLRQVAILDQFETRLLDLRPDTFQLGSYYTAYRDMVPELFRYLSDYSKDELMIYSKKARTADPLWYESFRPATLGSEHGLNYPIDAFQLFMTQAIVEKDSPEILRKYLDIPWLTTGDLFYVQKLAETIKAYRGWEWDAQAAGPCTLRADVNCDGRVSIADLSVIINNFGKVSTNLSFGDVNGDGNVNVADLSMLLLNFGSVN